MGQGDYMTAQLDVFTRVELTGLGQDDAFQHLGTDGTTPTAFSGKQYRTLATADTAEALSTGDVSTISHLVIRAIDYDLDVDLDYVSSFDADFTVKAGEQAASIPNPAGTVYVKNNGAGETPAYEFEVHGTT